MTTSTYKKNNITKQQKQSRKNKPYKQYKQYKKIFKGGYSQQYVKVLTKYHYIFGNYIFDKILNSEIFNDPLNINKLIIYLNEKSTNKKLINESQITEILKPALEDFINKVVKNNKPYPTSADNILIRDAFSLPTEMIIKKILRPVIIEKILKKSKKNKLIIEFKNDLEILKMNPIDKEAANDAAKEAVAAYAALTSIESKSTSDKSTKSNKGSNKTPTESNEHFGIMAAKPKSRKHINRRKRETRKKIKEGGGGGRQNGDYPGSDDEEVNTTTYKGDDDDDGVNDDWYYKSDLYKKIRAEQVIFEETAKQKYADDHRENIKATTEKISDAIHIINAVTPWMVSDMMKTHGKWYDFDVHQEKAVAAAKKLVSEVVKWRSQKKTHDWEKDNVDEWFEKIAKGQSKITDDWEEWEEGEMSDIDTVMNKVTVDAYNAAAIYLFGNLGFENWEHENWRTHRTYFFNYHYNFNDPYIFPGFGGFYRRTGIVKYNLDYFKKLREEWRDKWEKRAENPKFSLEFGDALITSPKWRYAPPPPPSWWGWEERKPLTFF